VKTQVQVALVIAALLYLAWGLGMLLAPELAHQMLSTAPQNPATAAMFTAALFAFAVVFFIGAHEPAHEVVHAAAAGLLFFGVAAAYQMFAAKTMIASPATVASLIINLGAAFFLLLSLTEGGMRVAAAPRARPAARRRTKRR
jgi:drug/metabolite transporter (DMT)-like permease